MLTSVIHIRDIALQTKNCFEDKLCPYTLEGRIHMKKTQIIIITIALILTLGCVGTFAVLFFATDIFKSEQKMFYKYISQIDLKEFIDLESYNTYSERLTTAGHANEGEFYIELVNDAETINESVKYDGYSDPVNKTENYDISINKDNDTLLAMNYLRNQDLYGLQFKDVINQYIVVENNNLKEFAAKMGVAAMHDVSRGGIFGALWEMASSAGLGIEAYLDKIKVRQETIEVCELLGLNPYTLVSGGALLMITENGDLLKEELEKLEIRAEVIGKLTDSNDRVVIKGEERRFLEPPKSDDIVKGWHYD